MESCNNETGRWGAALKGGEKEKQYTIVQFMGINFFVRIKVVRSHGLEMLFLVTRILIELSKHFDLAHSLVKAIRKLPEL